MRIKVGIGATLVFRDGQNDMTGMRIGRFCPPGVKILVKAHQIVVYPAFQSHLFLALLKEAVHIQVGSGNGGDYARQRIRTDADLEVTA